MKAAAPVVIPVIPRAGIFVGAFSNLTYEKYNKDTRLSESTSTFLHSSSTGFKQASHN